MSNRATIYIPEAASRVIGHTDKGELSGRIASILLRYEQAVRLSMPELTEAEWCAVVDANNGTVLDDTPSTVTLMWANVADSPEMGEKWGVDVDALAAKIRALDFMGGCAVAEVVRGFWSSPRLNELPQADLLREAGANII